LGELSLLAQTCQHNTETIAPYLNSTTNLVLVLTGFTVCHSQIHLRLPYLSESTDTPDQVLLKYNTEVLKVFKTT